MKVSAQYDALRHEHLLIAAIEDRDMVAIVGERVGNKVDEAVNAIVGRAATAVMSRPDVRAMILHRIAAELELSHMLADLLMSGES